MVVSFYDETAPGSGKYYLGNLNAFDTTEHDVHISIGTVSLVVDVDYEFEIDGRKVYTYSLTDETQMPRFQVIAKGLAKKENANASAKRKPLTHTTIHDEPRKKKLRNVQKK